MIGYRHWPHNGTSRIFVMKADGSDQRNLTRKDVWGPDWSPDGRRIAFNAVVGTGGFDVSGYVVAPDGSGLRRISRHYVEYPAWSPDGSRIAFMAPEPGATGSNPDCNIFVMDAGGSHVRRLTTAPGEDGWSAWSPDGTRIVFSSARDDCSISDAAIAEPPGTSGRGKTSGSSTRTARASEGSLRSSGSSSLGRRTARPSSSRAPRRCT